MAHLGLADTVDAAETLLDAVRVPRKIIVDHQVGTLEVDSLTCGVSRKKDADLGVELEFFLRLRALLAAQTTVNDTYSLLLAQQRADACGEVVQGVAVLGEDDQLLRG